MCRPNFFIIGAPKCGTTALAHYLSQHPDIFISEPKEPLYYLDERDSKRKIVNEEHYRSLFRKGGGCILKGEASVLYLFSKHALKAISSEVPEARIIVMRREPVGFVESFHSQLLFSGIETENDLKSAWEREKLRSFDINFDQASTIEEIEDWMLAYPELANHEKYIAEWQSVFGTVNVLVIDHADLILNVEKVYEDTLAFLGARSDHRANFPIINSNKVHRYKSIEHLLWLLTRNRFIVQNARRIKQVFGIGSFRLLDKLASFNAIERERPNVSSELANDIKANIDRTVTRR